MDKDGNEATAEASEVTVDTAPNALPNATAADTASDGALTESTTADPEAIADPETAADVVIAEPYTAEFARGNPRLTSDPSEVDARYGRAEATALPDVTADADVEVATALFEAAIADADATLRFEVTAEPENTDCPITLDGRLNKWVLYWPKPAASKSTSLSACTSPSSSCMPLYSTLAARIRLAGVSI